LHTKHYQMFSANKVAKATFYATNTFISRIDGAYCFSASPRYPIYIGEVVVAADTREEYALRMTRYNPPVGYAT